ncbi:MAG: hypothetical protein SFY32_03860 [Bacteroidota bacterium]|nr:hypothetical protein [Bacteroidota bacterium]
MSSIKKKDTKIISIENAKPELKGNLIIFDRKVKIFISVCFIAFFICVLFKLHGSSIGIWDSITGNTSLKNKSVILGTPKSIRSDEWLVQTPFLISQFNRKFSNENESWGAYNSPVAMGGPANDLTSHIKLNYLGFYLFNIEYGYSFYWNFKIYFLLISSFLLFMLLTKNNFWLSIFGSFWLYLSSGVQWWFSTSLPEMLISLCIITTSLLYLSYAKNLFHIIISSVSILLFSWVLVFHIYPPFQLLTFYTIVVLFLVLLLMYWDKILFRKNIYLKICICLVILSIDILLIYFFYIDTKQTIEIVQQTIYPGQRLVDHANFTWSRFFVNFFDVFLNETKFPNLNVWYNICESSGFLMLFPFIIPAIVFQQIRKKAIDYTYTIILSLIFLLTFSCFVELPDFLYKITLLSMISSVRCHLFVGFLSLVLTIYFLNDISKNSKFTNLERVITISIAALIYLSIYLNIKEILDQYITGNQFIIALILILILTSLTLFNFKFRELVFVGIIILFLSSNLLVNPITKGLGPILNNPLYKQVKNLNNQNSKWVVFGQMTFSNFIKTTGAKVISGVNYTPEKEKLDILDSKNQFQHIHNRYAHISFYPFINGTDSVAFVYDGNKFTDSYTIAMDPCSPKLKALGVQYYFFTYQPQPAEVRCLDLVDQNPFPIYKLKD